MLQNLCTRLHANADPRSRIYFSSLTLVLHFVLNTEIRRKRNYGKKCTYRNPLIFVNYIHKSQPLINYFVFIKRKMAHTF